MSFSDTFFEIYPEFIGKVDALQVDAVKKRVCVLYKVLQDGVGDEFEVATAMVVAHYIVRGGYIDTDDLGGAAGNPTGALVNASIGDASAAFQEKPIKDFFEDYFASTPYGQEFLAWLATIGGITLIN